MAERGGKRSQMGRWKNQKNLARFQGQKSPMIDWTKEENRADFKRQLEIAVCKFKVST